MILPFLDERYSDLEFMRRFNALTPGAPAAGLHPFGLYAAAGQPTSLTPLERERLERLGKLNTYDFLFHVRIHFKAVLGQNLLVWKIMKFACRLGDEYVLTSLWQNF